jgi:class 3 adenylate cyclase/tetratricopeptide (TPR) repeat protein
MTDVRQWLESVGLSQYADEFEENAIELDHLPDLDHDVLNALGVKAIGHRITILKAIARAGVDSDTPQALESDSISPATDQTPDKNAESGLRPDSTEEGELRHLTVMFCDLVGSTALAERLDPEDLRDLLGGYQNQCAEVIEHYEGFVAKYMGDGVLAYFCYPQAHEDDAERAVRAGLLMIDKMGSLSDQFEGIELKVRIGIATGSVVVGDMIGKGASQERSIVGEVPNLAARLQGIAMPNTVVIGSATQRLVGGLFEYESIENLDLRGISGSVRAWRVIGDSLVESRFEAAAASGLTKMVGREEEIGLLHKRWEQAREGEGQVVLLSGEAGIGKSRILRGFRERAEVKIRNRVLYFCSTYHQNTALRPVVDQLERALRFEKDDDVQARLDKIDDSLNNLGLDIREFGPVLAALLSIPTESRYPPLALPPGEAMTKTLETIVKIVEAMSRQSPVLMVVEDLHWVDASTRELLDQLIDRMSNLPILLVLTYRLEFEPQWIGHGHTSVITLNRLSRTQTAALVHNVSGGKSMPVELLDQIVAKTDGVALFVEEITKTVIESGLLEDAGDHYALTGPLQALAVPASLQDSLMARLDKLSPVKEVAQLAAAIGRSFSLDLLAAVSTLSLERLEDALSRLIDAELIYRRGSASDASYEFKHALVQDAAYASLLRAKRQQFHSQIAQVLEKGFSKSTETEPEILAHHYTEAGLPAQAIVYWLKAGELLHEQGSVAMSMATYQKALDIAVEDADRCHALIGLAGGMRVIDDYDGALALLEEAQSLATGLVLINELARIHHLRGNLYFPLGNVSGCLEEHKKALEFAQQAGDTENEARALSGLGDAHYSCGRMRTALDYFRRCVALSKEHDYYQIAVGNQYMVAWTRFYINEVKESLADAQEAIDAAVNINYLRAEMVARLTASRVLVELGELGDAIKHIDKGLQIADQLGANRFKPFLMIFQARIQLAQDIPRSETIDLMENAMKISRVTSTGFLGPWVLSMLALGYNDDRSYKALQEGESILAKGCVGHNYLAFYRNAMEASLELGDWDEVERYADALEAYCKPEPLERYDFYISRARALAKLGRDGRDEKMLHGLSELRSQAEKVGMIATIAAMDDVLTG